MATEDSIEVTVYGRGAHAALPQNSIDPVVLAAMIVVRLQTVVSREVAPGEIAVVTVGSIQAGIRSNIIPDDAVLQLNVRAYSEQSRQRILAAVQRIVRAECQGHRAHRPAGLPHRREGRAPAGPPQQPLTEIPAPAAAHPANRHRGPDHRRPGVARARTGNVIARPQPPTDLSHSALSRPST
jgi:metal-dependent amidase/aminoacylase/carboxypeptidase family protein